ADPHSARSPATFLGVSTTAARPGWVEVVGGYRLCRRVVRIAATARAKTVHGPGWSVDAGRQSAIVGQVPVIARCAVPSRNATTSVASGRTAGISHASHHIESSIVASARSHLHSACQNECHGRRVTGEPALTSLRGPAQG